MARIDRTQVVGMLGDFGDVDFVPRREAPPPLPQREDGPQRVSDRAGRAGPARAGNADSEGSGIEQAIDTRHRFAEASVLEDFTAVSGAATRYTENQLPVVTQDQGATNACGTTSLATVLTYWGQPTSHEEIDASIRHFNLFTAPDAIVAHARAQGLRSELKAGASLEDLASMVDQGVPPIVIIDNGSDDDLGLHYVTVCGYERDAAGNISELVLADSAKGITCVIKADEFARQWDHLKLGGVGTGLNNVMITIAPGDDRPVTGGDGVTRRASDIELPRSDAASTAESLFSRGVASVVSGVTAAADAIWQGVQAVGNAISNAWRAIFG